MTKEVVIKGISGKEAELEENFVISEGAMASVATNALMAATASNLTGKIHKQMKYGLPVTILETSDLNSFCDCCREHWAWEPLLGRGW